MFKELLIRFLREKNRIIKEFTGLDYICEEDVLEIQKEWAEATCQEFLKNMDCSSDADCCPWCYKHKLLDVDCLPCGYGNRHEYCESDSSTYSNIIGIINLPGMKDLINRFSKEVNKMIGEKNHG